MPVFGGTYYPDPPGPGGYNQGSAHDDANVGYGDSQGLNWAPVQVGAGTYPAWVVQQIQATPTSFTGSLNPGFPVTVTGPGGSYYQMSFGEYQSLFSFVGSTSAGSPYDAPGGYGPGYSGPGIPNGGGQGGGMAGRTFEQRAAALYPWLPEPLRAVFAQAWAETGDPNLALAEMRQSDLYDQYFAGNRRADGSFRYSEQEYMAVKDGFRQSIAEWGLDPAPFEQHFVGMIEGDKSLAEFRDNLSALWNGIMQNTDAVQEYYLDVYGVNVSQAEIMDNAQTVFAGLMVQAVDPDMSQQILSRQIRVAQVGGEALSFGFNRDVASVERLADLGVSQSQARQGYAQAAQQLPTLQALTSRYFDEDDSFGIDDFEAAIFELDPEQRRRAEGLIRSERSAFSGGIGVQQDRTGALTGLRAE